MKKIAQLKHGGINIKTLWSGFRPMYDYWGNELKRFYQFDTLVSAVNRYLEIKDKFILPSIHSVLGDSPVVSLKFHLFQEGKYQFIFQLTAENKKMRKALFSFVVAKNSDEFSTIARREHHLLKHYSTLYPEYVVKPYLGDYLFFPDRYGRKEHHRNIYAYLTQWLSGYEELGLNKDLQFFTNVPKPYTFSLADTNYIKMKIIEIIIRLYDEKKKVGIALPEIASGDFVIKRSKSGLHKLKLIACRKTINNLTPAKLISLFLNTSWKWGNKEFVLIPEQPKDFIQSFVNAIGIEKTQEWFTELWKFEAKWLNNVKVHKEYLEAVKKLTSTKKLTQCKV